MIRGRRPSSAAKASIVGLAAPAHARVAVERGAVDARHALGPGAVAAEDLLQRVGDLADGRAQRASASIARSSRLPVAARARPRSAPRARPPPRRRRAWRGPLARRVELRLAHRGVVDLADRRARLPRPSRYLLTPTMTSSPRSMRACFSAAHCSMRSLAQPVSTALVMPPIASTSSMIAHALSAMSCVSFSIRYEPAQGSITSQMCVSSWMISCVLRAMRAEKSVGSAIASSNELVCSDCVPPNTAAIASIGGAHDVVVRVLLGQRPAGGLAVRAQHHRLRVLRREALHDPPPQQARRAQLGDLQVEVHADGEEERQPAGEVVDVHAARRARCARTPCRRRA